jgi:thiol-disulfide isomerase/thioredoxin
MAAMRAIGTTLLLGLLASVTSARDETWRAVLLVGEDGTEELPFGLELVELPGGDGWTAFLLNDPERIEVPVVEWDGTSLLLEMPHYDSRIRARRGDDGALVGSWEKVRGRDRVARVPFRASAGEATRFVPEPPGAAGAPGGSVDGRWRADFETDDLPAVGVFAQPDGASAVRGTFLTATGDYRFLAGSLEGGRLRLSCFDGAHAFLFDARLEETDAGPRLSGVFHSGNWWRETWTATPDASAGPVDAFAQTTWDERISLADLVFPDLEGVPRSLADPALGGGAGRATLLVLFGSWCPNCHDEAAYLVELDARYRERGLSIVGLAFELDGDFERDAEQVKRFRERHGVEYPLLLVGTSDKALASQAFPAIDRLRSYPTTIFLDPGGNVRSVHSGFAGPATGAEHTALRREFETLIEALLAEEPPTDASYRRFLTTNPWSSDVEFAGATYVFREDEGGGLVADYTLHGSGLPVLEEETLPVRLAGDAVWIGDALWRLDRRAGVLVDPRRFGARLFPAGGSRAPMIASAGLHGEERIREAFASPDPLLRREALVALAESRANRDAGALAEATLLLADDDHGVRVAAAWAAGELREESAVEPLLALRTHPSAALRREVTRALGRLASGAPDASAIRAALEELAADPDPLVRDLAREALASK